MWLEPVSLILTLNLVLMMCLELLVVRLHLPAGLWTQQVRAMTHISAARFPPGRICCEFISSVPPPAAHPQMVTKVGNLTVPRTRTYEREQVLSGCDRRPKNQGLAAGAWGLPSAGADRRAIVAGRPHLALACQPDRLSRRVSR